ncbi:MAG: sensor histidine kinase, partial [Anaerolineae bacterium]|nr:sensor histidine kinase [Anaerolineae bacterium]
SRERIVTAREEERRRLRRDLHDGLGPVLFGLTLKLDAISNLMERDPAAAHTIVDDLKRQAQGTIVDIRRLVYELRPPALDELGLVSALREYASHSSANEGASGEALTNGSGQPVRVSIEAPSVLPTLPAAVEVAVYRIALEALTNTTRHAHAHTCVIRLALIPADALEVEIVDDGVGLSPDHRAGVGLTSMRERAEELGGSCSIESGVRGGTRVVARIPLLKE